VPYPNQENTLAAEKMQEQLKKLLKEVDRFYPISDALSTNVMSNGEFKLRLIQTVAELQRRAHMANVVLPTNFNFSFNKQYQLMQLASNSPALLSSQVTDVATICDILFKSQIPELLMLRRSSVTKDDQEALSTMPQDYIASRPLQTNDWSIRYPYEIVFKSLTPEVKSVLEGFAHSSRGFVVRTVKVEPYTASSTTAEDGSVTGGSGEQRDFNATLMARYGMRSRYGAPAAQAAPTPAAPPKPAVGTVVDKQPLKVTIMVESVRPKPATAAAPAPVTTRAAAASGDTNAGTPAAQPTTTN